MRGPYDEHLTNGEHKKYLFPVWNIKCIMIAVDSLQGCHNSDT